LSALGCQERFDFAKQVDWMRRRQLGGRGDTTTNDDASIESTKLGNTAYQSAFRLPATNCGGVDGCQAKGISKPIRILLHQVIDVGNFQASEPGSCNSIDRRGLINRAVHG
jgi:hypothetical protein